MRVATAERGVNHRAVGYHIGEGVGEVFEGNGKPVAAGVLGGGLVEGAGDGVEGAQVAAGGVSELPHGRQWSGGVFQPAAAADAPLHVRRLKSRCCDRRIIPFLTPPPEDAVGRLRDHF